MSTTLTAGSTPTPATTKKTRKPRTKKQRFVRLAFSLPTAGEVAVRIREVGPRSEREDWYFVAVLPSDFGFATSWEKWTISGGDGKAYQTNAGGNDGPACCDCLGFEKHGHCRHVEATRALLAAGALKDGQP